MNKKILLMPALLALVGAGLTSCGGDSADNSAFAECLNKTLLQDGKGGDILLGAGAKELEFSDIGGNMLKLTTKQELASGAVAEIEWDYNKESSLIANTFSPDASHTMLEFNFPANGTTAQEFELTIKSIKIGNRKIDHSEVEKIYKLDVWDDIDETTNTSVYLMPQKYMYESKSLATIYSMTDGKYDIVNYEAKTDDSPFKFNKYPVEDAALTQKKPDVQVQGKITYIAPDYDFGMLADGDNYIQFFFGGGRTTAAANFPACRVGNYVNMYGALEVYKGNWQISLMPRIELLKDHSNITEPAAPKALTETDLANVQATSAGKHKYAVEGYMNSMRTVTGSYEAGSLKNSQNTAVTSITTNAVRHTFNLTVGGQTLPVHFDYHTAESATCDLINKLNEVFADPTKSFEITGTLRYEGGATTSAVQNFGDNGTGVWRLVPLQASDIK